MRGISTELKVGLFAVIVIAILSFMTFKVGGLEWLQKEGNIYYVYFKNIAGLDEKTKVKIAGVDSGVIEKIDLRDGQARLTLKINKGIQLYSDAAASIKASGLLGDKYLEIKIGSETPVLKKGDTIKNVLEIVDIDDMVRKIVKVSDGISTLASLLNETLGTEEAKRSLRETVLNLGAITSNLNDTIISNDKKMKLALDSVNTLTTSINDLVAKNRENITVTMDNLQQFTGKLKSEGPDLIANLNKASRELRDLVEENRPMIKSTVESVNNITGKIDRGEGTFGKLVKDDKLYYSVEKAAAGIEKTVSAVDRFKTFITFQADYLTRPGDAKGYIYVTLQPRPDRYYILGVVGDPVAKETTKDIIKTVDGVTTHTKIKKVEKKIEFTAQYAMRFDNAALRLGMTENTFGAGADYFFNSDKGKVSADVWDVSGDEEGADNPHVKVGVDYFIFKNIFLSAGADNIMNSKRRGAYAGMGLKFEDEDLKYLFGILPRISTQ